MTKSIGFSALARVGLLLLLFLGPVVANIVFWVYSPEFIASSKLHWLAGTLSIAGAGFFLLAMLGQTHNVIWRYFSEGSVEGLKALLVTLFAPIFGFFIWHSLVTGPISYLLHTLSPPAKATVIERVTRLGSGHRGCRHSAYLSGHTFLFKREICGLSEEQEIALQSGGAAVLHGEQSQYGFTYSGVTIRR